MENKFELSVLMPAYARAQHAISSGNPVFADYAVRSLITAEEYADVRTYILDNKGAFAGDKAFPNDNIAVKYITEKHLTAIPVSYAAFCEESLINSGTEQYVILGAGLDTFALRESELINKITVFEVDNPNVQEIKKTRLNIAGMNVPDRLKLVPGDFTKTDFLKNLEAAGFDRSKKTFFSLNGSGYRMSEEEIGNLLGYIRSIAPEGSSIVMDVFLKRLKKEIKFATEYSSFKQLMEKSGFKTAEYLAYEDINKRYFAGRSDSLEADNNVFYLCAVLKGKTEKKYDEKPVRVENKEERKEEKKEVIKHPEKTMSIKLKGTKETIFKTALKMFAQRGFEAVSVRDIAGEIGITQAALYKHYTNKRDIFDSIVSFMEKKTEEAFKNLEMEQWLLEYYRYWTEDEYAVEFRKILTVEQYGDNLSAKLYKKYFTSGVLKKIEAMTGDRERAVEIYSVIYLMMNMYESTDNKKFVEKYLNTLSK